MAHRQTEDISNSMSLSFSNFDLASYVIGIVIFPLAGVLAYKCLERIENRIKNFRKYEPIIAYEVACAIGQIANITGQGFEQTKGELKELIDYGYLPNRYINEMTGMLMMNNR